ncbi:unnamed protein product [Mytilus coruscus]|uniref:Uncharacterized protein n=1 Tax=Mytilus coruscus TaxID=42192 RepID=A0A6J8C1V3_MYTCO|nr:unnamed protein product [Mytilus coruscus]
MDSNNDNSEEIYTVSNDQELASIIQNSDEHCTIIIVDENHNFKFTDSVVNNISETHINRSFNLNEEQNTEHVYANVQILYPTTSSTCSNKFQTSRNAEDFDTIEQIDEVSSHQGEGNVNKTTGEQNVEKTEEQNEETTEEQNEETSCDTNANDDTMRSRKRKRQSELWKQNLRKR